MEELSIIALLGYSAQFGLPGLVLVLWWINDRANQKMIGTYRDDMQKALGEHGKHMEEIRRMYESNVRLVQGYESVARDLKDIVIINTQTMTTLNDNIRNNQYCPRVRLEKRAKGKQT